MSLDDKRLHDLFSPKIDETPEKLEKPCLGIIYKAENTTYQTKKGFANTIKLNLCKKLSCPGCKKCEWLHDTLNEFLSCNGNILGLEKVKHGKYYSLTTANVSMDWETGYVDDYDLKLVEVEIEK